MSRHHCICISHGNNSADDLFSTLLHVVLQASCQKLYFHPNIVHFYTQIIKVSLVKLASSITDNQEKTSHPSSMQLLKFNDIALGITFSCHTFNHGQNVNISAFCPPCSFVYGCRRKPRRQNVGGTISGLCVCLQNHNCLKGTSFANTPPPPPPPSAQRHMHCHCKAHATYNCRPNYNGNWNDHLQKKKCLHAQFQGRYREEEMFASILLLFVYLLCNASVISVWAC